MRLYIYNFRFFFLPMKKTEKFYLPVLFVALAILSFIYSQFYETGEQIFLTDTIYITPKAQPVYFVIFVFANVILLLGSLYLGLLLALFLFKKGIIFQTVGILLLIAAVVMTFMLVRGDNIKGTKDYIIVVILILFLGTMGLFMTFANKIGKRKN